MRPAPRLALVVATTLSGAVALAQTPPAPWGAAPPASGAATAPPPARVPSGAWPSRPAPAPPPGPPTALTPGLAAANARLQEATDPAYDHAFQMPNARVLRVGDLMGHYVGHLGWVGARYGLTRSIDVGAGVPYYFLGISLDARVSFVQRPGLAASWWAYVSVPFQADGDSSTSSLGFTWAHAGMGWMTGPLVSIWGRRAGFHAGVHVAQRTGLGGLWLFSHATVEVQVVAGMKAIGQMIALYEVAPETGDRARALLGNEQPRFLPYALAGMRLFTRHFAADFGALVPIVAEAPLASERLPVLPWVSLAHLF